MADSSDKEKIERVSGYLNEVSKKYNFQIAPTLPNGRPAKGVSGMREFRLQLINSSNDTSEKLKSAIVSDLKKNKSIKSVKLNPISPNSSKYSSVSFIYEGLNVDVVVAKGSNKGENFEKKVVTDLKAHFRTAGINSEYHVLIAKMGNSNRKFDENEIKSVAQRTGSTKKEGVPIENLGAIIGDIVLTDSVNKNWFISLKDVNGATFSSYSGASSLFNATGDIQPNSEGAKFLKAFGADLNQVQRGFDERNKKTSTRSKIPTSSLNSGNIKSIFERAWGMNYFYVRKTNDSDGWKVFWIDKKTLDKLSNGIRVDSIRYPNEKSKQITILCSNSFAEYTIELRNSKAGEYPNDIKFKVNKLKV
jgi:hypothetical protein